jgi:Rrf2 family protein
MKISTRGRYGLRAMLDLAQNYEDSPVYVKDIARRQQVSEQYLEHILTTLKVSGMVISSRGKRGGFTLAKRPGEINLNDIIQAIEGSLHPVECVDNPETCDRASNCATRDVWIDVKEAVTGVLSSRTLQDLMEQQAEKGQASAI